MTNGTITKKLLKAGKTQTGTALLETAKSLFERFPLSSVHLLYDRDSGTVSPEAWAVLLQAAVETDKVKLEQKNRLLAGYGMKPEKEFGRYSQK